MVDSFSSPTARSFSVEALGYATGGNDPETSTRACQDDRQT